MNYRVVEPWIEQSLERNSWQPYRPNIEWAYNVWVAERTFLASALPPRHWASIEEGMRFHEDIAVPDAARSLTREEAELLTTALSSARAAEEVLATLASHRLAGNRW